MEKGKAFPYVPIYSLPINPHSSSPSCSVHAYRFPPSYQINLPSTELPLVITWLLSPRAQPRRPALRLPSPEERQPGETRCPWGNKSWLPWPCWAAPACWHRSRAKPSHPLRTPSLLQQRCKGEVSAFASAWTLERNGKFLSPAQIHG